MLTAMEIKAIVMQENADERAVNAWIERMREKHAELVEEYTRTEDERPFHEFTAERGVETEHCPEPPDRLAHLSEEDKAQYRERAYYRQHVAQVIGTISQI
jgi:hypothetical protein